MSTSKKPSRDYKVPYRELSSVIIGQNVTLCNLLSPRRWCMSGWKTKSFLVLLTLCGFLFLLLAYHVSIRRHAQSDTVAGKDDQAQDVLPSSTHTDHIKPGELRFASRVLVVVETQYSKHGKSLLKILEANRMPYKIAFSGKSLPFLTHMDKGKFGVIVFENLHAYLKLDKWNRQLLDKYCKQYDVGIILFVSPSSDMAELDAVSLGFPFTIRFNAVIKDYRLNPVSSLLRITRADTTVNGPIAGENWAAFISNHSSYRPIAFAKAQSQNVDDSEAECTIVLQDVGAYDGVQRIIFGNTFVFWLHRLLFLDSLSYLSRGKLGIPLDRYIQIDIDDIFVGRPGIRMVPADVQALIAFQRSLRKEIPRFQFHLGFSGKFFKRGTIEEDDGDEVIVRHARRFSWFDHSWSHTQAHIYKNLSIAMEDMKANLQFAHEHKLPVDRSYAVSPHHSGVYPVHAILYEAWKRVLGIKVTSSEEYPHINPPHRRSGFIHRGIMVLPRQTCGLFTHTIFLKEYPEGVEKLNELIEGGELFLTLLYNPINIYMTHLSNFGNDRLGIYTFEKLVAFVKTWTNLRLLSAPPLELADRYFSLYPKERDPIWHNPCLDVRHRTHWASVNLCDQMPHFLVIGPQKTGTTALYTFLRMHPQISSNYPSSSTFEEVQFFSGGNYFRGVEWYLNFFPTPLNTTEDNIRFEKSATYFDKDMVPKRAHALLPKAKLICILIDPGLRAHSWYQHKLAHGDPTALTYGFYDVITASNEAPKAVRDLRNRCLHPGFYAHHLERWLNFYPPRQLLVLDGDMLKHDPVSVMSVVQEFIGVEVEYNYSSQLVFDNKKGFFCALTQNGRSKCLGRGKGRSYPAMATKEAVFLQKYYRRHNVALYKLLKSRLGQSVPDWLMEVLTDV